MVPLTSLGVASAATTRLLRNSPDPVVTVKSAEEYAAVVAAAGIMVDMDARKLAVLASARELAATTGGVIPSSSQVPSIPRSAYA